MEEITVLDRQIEQLYDYKPIPEHEVKALCDKVSQGSTIGTECLTKMMKCGSERPGFAQ